MEDIKKTCIDCVSAACACDKQVPSFCEACGGVGAVSLEEAGAEAGLPAELEAGAEAGSQAEAARTAALHAQMLALYKDEELILAQRALETAHEMAHHKLTRSQTTIDFINRMGYKKIGIATCVSFQKEARLFAGVLRKLELEVYGVSCKAGSLKYGEFECSQDLNPESIACNPIYQAEKLNEHDTDFNVVIGLCVGHDSLFINHSKAPCTVLSVKDRKTNAGFRAEIKELAEQA